MLGLLLFTTGEVLEEMEDRERLVKEVRNKVNLRVDGTHDEKIKLYHKLFGEIDVDDSGLINKLEFRRMLCALHLHYT